MQLGLPVSSYCTLTALLPVLGGIAISRVGWLVSSRPVYK